MKKFNLICAAVAFAVAAPAFAGDEDVLPMSTDEITMYRNAGDWSVHQNLTRKTCFISRSGENGGLIQMGLTKEEDYGYVGIFSKNLDVEEGIKEIAILVNDNVYVGHSKGVTHNLEGGYKGGYVLGQGKEFRMDLEKGEELIAFPDSPYVYIVNLKGSSNAIYEARKCTNELQGG